MTFSLQRRLLAIIRLLLKQVLAQEKVALAIAIGTIIGIFPIIGTTTLLSVLLASWLRLNQPLVLTLNYAMTPIEILLIIPFIRIGEFLLGTPPFPHSVEEFRMILDQGSLGTIEAFGTAMISAFIGWFVFAPIIALSTYASSIFLVKRINLRRIQIK